MKVSEQCGIAVSKVIRILIEMSSSNLKWAVKQEDTK